MRKLNEDESQEIIDLYTYEKLSTVQIASRVGISSTGVAKILKRYGISIRSISEAKKGQRRQTNHPEKDIINFYNEGNSSIETGKKFNLSKQIILRILKNNSIDRRKIIIRKSIYDSLHNSIIEYYNKGNSLIQTSKKFSVPYSVINKILKRNNKIRSFFKCKGMKGKHHDDKTKDKVRATRKLKKESGLYDHIYLKKTGYTYEEFQKKLPEFKKYHQQVKSITMTQPIKLLENYNKRGKAGKNGAYHLDHKYSIIAGFKHKIDPKIIGHISNLHMITWESNMIKQGDCWITINDLLKLQNN